MKTVEERVAEITRRSEKIIRQRKQRRSHILMACIPAALLVGIYTAFALPGMMPEKVPELNSRGPDKEYFDSTEGSTAALYAGSVEVSGLGISWEFGALEDVTRITDLIGGILASPETDNTANWDVTSVIDSSTKGYDGERISGITILITDADGTVTEYCLTKAALVNQNTYESCAVSEDEYWALRDALGVPDN